MTNQVATTILQQLGGNKFIAMTGAKNFLGSKDALSFRIPTRKGPNALRITLAPSDTYEVKAFRIRGTRCDVIDIRDDIYAENLREVFERMTGLRTSL